MIQMGAELMEKYLDELEADKFLSDIRECNGGRKDYLKTPSGRSLLVRLISREQYSDRSAQDARMIMNLSQLEEIADECNNVFCINEAIDNVLETRSGSKPVNKAIVNTLKGLVYKVYELKGGNGKVLISYSEKTGIPMAEFLTYIAKRRNIKPANA